MARALDIRDLSVAYGGIKALHGVSLSAEPGEIVAVLGANGAGKTTLLHAVAGLIPAGSGDVMVGGEPIRRWRAERIARSGVSLIPEGRRIFTHLTVAENLRLGAYFSSSTVYAKRFAELADLFPILGQRRYAYAGHLSGGEQQIVALARGLISKPDILLLDEPSAGLSPIATAAVYASLASFAADAKLTMLLVEQNVRWGLEMAARGYVLELGHVQLAGSRQELQADPRVSALYLGEIEA